MPDTDKPLIVLAPMEGLLDFTLRDILTRVGGIDRCVSEFIRITRVLLPERVFLRIVPELAHGGCTPSGVPVRAQLLGSDPQCLAENAARLAAMGSPGVDLNFGCPAKVVNRHGGGATLLNDPELLHRIACAVRAAVPSRVPVSAKMRLGDRDDARAEDCARALVHGGVSELVVHARTRVQGYRPPAHWARIADIRAVVDVPVIANGEIWTVKDALACQHQSGCAPLMLGRGMVSDPGLAWAIRAAWQHEGAVAGVTAAAVPGWDDLRPQLLALWEMVCARLEPRQRAGRVKLWLNYLRRRFPQAQAAYEEVRTLTRQGDVDAWLRQLAQLPDAAQCTGKGETGHGT